MKYLKIFENFDISDDDLEEIKSIFQDIVDEFNLERKIGNTLYNIEGNGIYYDIFKYKEEIFIEINLNGDEFLDLFIDRVVPELENFAKRIKPLGYRLFYLKNRVSIINEFYDFEVYTIEVVKDKTI